MTTPRYGWVCGLNTSTSIMGSPKAVLTPAITNPTRLRGLRNRLGGLEGSGGVMAGLWATPLNLPDQQEQSDEDQAEDPQGEPERVASELELADRLLSASLGALGVGRPVRRDGVHGGRSKGMDVGPGLGQLGLRLVELEFDVGHIHAEVGGPCDDLLGAGEPRLEALDRPAHLRGRGVAGRARLVTLGAQRRRPRPQHLVGGLENQMVPVTHLTLRHPQRIVRRLVSAFDEQVSGQAMTLRAHIADGDAPRTGGLV